MAELPSMPLFTDALLGDTTHLSAEEFGAYLLILIVTWRNNGVPLPDDDKRMARICRVTVRRWSERLRPVMAPFFNLTERTWRQKRLEKEWSYVIAFSTKQRELINRRWAKVREDKSLNLNETHDTSV